ncbi:MAG: glycosyltransferase family 2 protein [Ignavibacteria bacterium]|nr:glycosyltransferase family 2 protein [Ignavibacteria bacterium]
MKNKNQQTTKYKNDTDNSEENILNGRPEVSKLSENFIPLDAVTNSGLYRKLIEIFDKELEDDGRKEAGILVQAYEESILKDELKRAKAIIQELTNKLNGKQNTSPNTETVSNGQAILSLDTLEAEPVTIRPEEKREGIFNDVNLTEDYELGLRFYQLGLKSGFFNVKLDGDKNSTRVSTAEFFPNKFWPAVKQRSRWIAGICFQNWKAHKWNGNLRTKYFLFRDRKPIISFWSTFLSNVILLYFIYLAIGTAFNIDNSLISGKIPEPLWFLMIFNLVFMISKSVHRFIFTYNWYGFSYALASIFRLAIDSFINFFAIIRSVSVYHKTKKKVVWDATTHY